MNFHNNMIFNELNFSIGAKPNPHGDASGLFPWITGNDPRFYPMSGGYPPPLVGHPADRITRPYQFKINNILKSIN
jgi:hypothetical protein